MSKSIAASVPQFCVGALLFPSVITEEWCRGFVLDEYSGSGAHALWTYPLNAVVTLATIGLFPVSALVAFVAAGILKLIAYCSKEPSWHQDAAQTFGAGLCALLTIGFNVAAIFRPDLDQIDYLPEIALEWQRS